MLTINLQEDKIPNDSVCFSKKKQLAFIKLISKSKEKLIHEDGVIYRVFFLYNSKYYDCFVSHKNDIVLNFLNPSIKIEKLDSFDFDNEDYFLHINLNKKSFKMYTDETNTSIRRIVRLIKSIFRFFKIKTIMT